MKEIYEKVYDIGVKFFKKIIEMYKEKQYDYIVLTTRRCFCLFFALYNDDKFKDNFDEQEQKILCDIMSKVISSQGVNIIGEKFNNKNILLLDDVMIHGHAVYKIYENIKQNVADGTIDTLVVIRNAELPDFYLSKTKKEYSYIQMEVAVEWRHISNCIVRYLHHRGQSYTSFIYGFKITRKHMEESLCNLKKVNLEFENLETYAEFDEYPSYYISEICDSNSFVETAMIRVYYLPDKENCVVVPYVLLKDIKNNCLDKIWHNLCNFKSLEYQFEDIKTPEDKYKALSAICGITLYKKYFKDIDSYENVIDKSFTPSFLKTVYSNFDYQEVFQIIKNEYSEVLVNQEHTLMENYVKRTCAENFVETFTDFIKAYLYSVTEEEEYIYRGDIYFENDKYDDYMKPIYLSLVFDFLNNLNCICFDRTIAKAEIMFLADIGLLSYVVRKNGDYIGTCIKTGEQSYKLFVNLSKSAYKALYVIINYINKIEQVNLRNEIMKKIESNYDNYGFTVKQWQLLQFFIKKLPLDLQDHYFGPLQMMLKTESVQKNKEANIMLNNAIELMEFCCGGNFII
jgi:hypothetical protein